MLNLKKVIVVGAGLGGLSAAALLAKQKYEVTLIEKNETYGGRAMIFKEKGYTFDMGPSWYLMPQIFEDFFKLFDKKTSNYYQLIKLDPSYRIFFSKDELIDIFPELKRNITTFESIEKGAGNQLIKYLEQSKYRYNLSLKEFIYKEYKNIFDFIKPRFLKDIFNFGLTQSLNSYVNTFFKSEKLRKIMQYSGVFLGGNPKNIPALYSLMSHIDFNQGVFYPKGGIGEVTKALYNLCIELGVSFKFKKEVTSIIVEKSQAKGVKTVSGELYMGDILVVNADYHFAETKLLDKQYQTFNQSYWDKRIIAPSAFIIYLGINKKLNNIIHHNLILENDWVKHFDDIFVKKILPESPSYYVCCPSKTDNSVAPEGCENLFILVPIPAGINDNEEIRKIYSDKIIKDIEKYIGSDFKQNIEVKKILSVSDYISLYNSYKGTALGLSHTLFQSTLWRPSHISKKVKGLYYTGQYTNPGIGMAMTIVSSQIVLDEINKLDK